MARQKADEVKKEVEEDKLETYGDEHPLGSASTPTDPTDDDAGDESVEMLEDMIGNEPEEGKPFSLADEVEKDEKGEDNKRKK